MLRSSDIGSGAYSSGRPFISSWGLVEGYPRCVEPSLSIAANEPAELAAQVARNRAVAARLAQVEALEAAKATTRGEPPDQWVIGPGGEPVVSSDWTAWQMAQAVLAGAGADLLHLMRTRAGELGDDEVAYELVLPGVPTAFDPCTHTADWDGTSWISRALTTDELAAWPLRRAPMISKMAFARLLQDVLGTPLAGVVLSQFQSVLALATDVDVSDVFDAVDGGLGYAAQLMAAGTVTADQVAELRAAWPLG